MSLRAPIKTNAFLSLASEAPSPLGGGAFVLADKDELGVVWGAMCDAETDEVRTGSHQMAAFVSAIPSHLMYTGVERRIHQGAHALALDVVDSHMDGCGMIEVEADVGSCVEGVGPHLE